MNAAIILSGGVGTRLGADIPKQYIKVDGKTILSYCIDTFIHSHDVDMIAIVCAEEWREEIEKSISLRKPIIFALPGETRQLSILNALNEIRNNYANTVKKVIIQDGARPLCSQQLISECIQACEPPFLGVMPVLPMKDTIYLSKDGNTIDRLINRDTLFAGQAPEAFCFEEYCQAHLNLTHPDLLEIKGSSELAFKAGMKIRMIPGDSMNFKITEKSDLEQFKSILRSR